MSATLPGAAATLPTVGSRVTWITTVEGNWRVTVADATPGTDSAAAATDPALSRTIGLPATPAACATSACSVPAPSTTTVCTARSGE